MPTIPLLDPDVPFGSWHKVRAPGGYESWRIEAHDRQTDRRFICEFCYGDTAHPEYVKDFFSFTRNPTRIAPPVPRKWIGLRTVLISQGRIETSHCDRFAAEQFSAASEGLDIRLGPNRLAREDNGAVAISVESIARITLKIHPRNVTAAQIDTRAAIGMHAWHFMVPAGSATGEINGIPFNGDGSCEYFMGDRPLQASIGLCLRGRILNAERFVACQISSTQAQMLECDASGARQTEPNAVDLKWSGNQLLAADANGILELRSPRLLESTGARSRYLYEAQIRSRAAQAICEIAHS